MAKDCDDVTVSPVNETPPGSAPSSRARLAAGPTQAACLIALCDESRAAGDDDSALRWLNRLAALRPDDDAPRQRMAEIHVAADRLADAAAALVETGRLSRAGFYLWKTAYYHLVRICNDLIGRCADDTAAALVAAAAQAWRGQDEELRAWALFLAGSLALRRGQIGPARAAFTQARPYLPFLAHVCVGDMFLRRAEALPAARLAAFDAQLDWRKTAENPNDGPVTFVACDGAYLKKFAPLFLAALERFAASERAVHIHVVDDGGGVDGVVDDSAADFIAALSAGARRLRIGWSAEKSPTALNAEQKRTFYTFCRFLRLNQIAARYPGAALLVADVDACVMADPAAFIAPLNAAAPLALQYFPENLARIYDGIGAGLAVLMPQPDVLALFDRIRRFLWSWVAEGRLHYFLDQMALVAAVDDAQKRGIAPGIFRLAAEGRIFRCGDGAFVQIIDEKRRADFDTAAAALTERLRRQDDVIDLDAERYRIAQFLGIGA